MKSEFAALVEELETDPKQGTELGSNCYKIRLSIASKRKGKSGDARVITNFIITEHTVFLIAIYDKSEQEDLSDKELAQLLKYVPE